MEHNPNLTAAYLMGAVDKHVKGQARRTVRLNAERDPNARYARIPDGEACEFCKALGSRGFVYRSEDSAGADDPDRYHPHCNCQVAVSFDPFIEDYWVGPVHVTRGYGMEDAQLVRPGRDGSFELRDADIDELFEQYKAAGRSFNKRSVYRDYAGMPKFMADPLAYLRGAETVEQLEKRADEVLAAYKRHYDDRQLAKYLPSARAAAKQRMAELKAERNAVSGVSAAVDPEVSAWARKFKNEELWVQRESGKPFYREGSPTEVTTTDVEDASFRNGKAKHTHTTAIGGTFGEDDVWFTAKIWLSEHEVEDTYHGHSYKLVRSADASEEMAERFARAYEEMSFSNYDRILGDIYDANGGDLAHGYGPTLAEKIEAETQLKSIQHEWLSNNAEAWGYDYFQVT